MRTPIFSTDGNQWPSGWKKRSQVTTFGSATKNKENILGRIVGISTADRGARWRPKMQLYEVKAPKIIPVATSARWTDRPVNNWKLHLHWKSKDGDESMTRDQHVKLQHPWIKQEESELQVPHKRSCSALKSKGNLIWASILWLVGNVNKSFRLNYCDNVKSHSWIRMHRLHEVLKH